MPATNSSGAQPETDIRRRREGTRPRPGPNPTDRPYIDPKPDGTTERPYIDDNND